ncbi:MAG: hypothetical protein MRY32_03360 [Rickettsiales bacterium]|nr:hypothetical protein [Rickettsiales bacterium]
MSDVHYSSYDPDIQRIYPPFRLSDLGTPKSQAQLRNYLKGQPWHMSWKLLKAVQDLDEAIAAGALSKQSPMSEIEKWVNLEVGHPALHQIDLPITELRTALIQLAHQEAYKQAQIEQNQN